MRRNFHQDISEQTGEISAMGFSLFDRYGRLKPGFKRGSARPGSGLLVDELDRGDVFLIEHVEIDKRYGPGYGSYHPAEGPGQVRSPDIHRHHRSSRNEFGNWRRVRE